MKIEFVKNADEFGYYGTEVFWDALFDCGYIKPERLVENKEQLETIVNAMAVLNNFKSQMEQKKLYDPS